MIFAWIGLSARLFQIMIIDSDEYRKQAFDQAQKHETLLPVRGNIYDRNNVPLTQSIIHYSFIFNPIIKSCHFNISHCRNCARHAHALRALLAAIRAAHHSAGVLCRAAHASRGLFVHLVRPRRADALRAIALARLLTPRLGRGRRRCDRRCRRVRRISHLLPHRGGILARAGRFERSAWRQARCVHLL